MSSNRKCLVGKVDIKMEWVLCDQTIFVIKFCEQGH